MPRSSPDFSRALFEESLSLDGPPDATVTIGNRNYEYYSGNGFFGLQAHPAIIASVCESVLKYGLGTATTRSSFTSPPVFDVERRLASALGTERAFYLASAYLANHIVLNSLEGTFDRVFIDESSHPSLFDAIRILHGTKYRPNVFKHRNIEHLEQLLKESLAPGERPILLSDGLFSSFGTIAPLDDYIKIFCEYPGSSILIDDVCGFGVLGENGRGTLEHFRFDTVKANRTIMDFTDFGDMVAAPASPTKMYFTVSMSKAVGGFGGGIAGSTTFIEHLFETSKVLGSASAPPNPIASATACGLSILFDDDELRNQLRRNVLHLKMRLRDAGFEVDDTPVPIALLKIGSAVNMRKIQSQLLEKDILITYLPRIAGLGSEGALRIAVFATHTEDMIDRLVDTLTTIV